MVTTLLTKVTALYRPALPTPCRDTCPSHSHSGQLTEGLLIVQVLTLAEDLGREEGAVRLSVWGIPLVPWRTKWHPTHPCPIAGCLIAIQQGINERLAHTLERCTGVSKIEQVGAEILAH